MLGFVRKALRMEEIAMEKFYKKGHLARRGKRWPALLMSICLIGTMLPVTARAEPDRVVSSNILSDYNVNKKENWNPRYVDVNP